MINIAMKCGEAADEAGMPHPCLIAMRPMVAAQATGAKLGPL